MAKDEEYKFPDEKETKADKEEKVEYEIEGDGETQVEVVDDTPEEDRGRRPMEEPPKDFAEDKTDEQIKDFEIAINEKKEITEEWMVHLFTVVLLIRAIEDKAEENGLLEDVDVSQSDS